MAMSDDGREELERLRQRNDELISQLDGIVRRNAPDYWANIEGVELYQLFYLVWSLALNLSARITNIEEMLLFAATQRDQARQIGFGAYRSDRERQEDGAAAATLGSEYDLLQRLAQGQGPINDMDRANIVLMLRRLLDRFVWTYNEFGKIEGWPPVSPAKPGQ